MKNYNHAQEKALFKYTLLEFIFGSLVLASVVLTILSLTGVLGRVFLYINIGTAVLFGGVIYFVVKAKISFQNDLDARLFKEGVEKIYDGIEIMQAVEYLGGGIIKSESTDESFNKIKIVEWSQEIGQEIHLVTITFENNFSIKISQSINPIVKPPKDDNNDDWQRMQEEWHTTSVR